MLLFVVVNFKACQECAFYKRGEHCEESTCPIDFYADDERRECLPCLNECRGCHGPTAMDCEDCRHFRVYSVSKKVQV